MCLTAPALVLAIDGAWADVRMGSLVRRASTLAAPDVRAGDWVLVAAGTVIRALDREQAAEMERAVATARKGED